ncbi:PREDICTED: mucin-17-like [Brassica oleracea var. oleracea]|uniref:mucin-17-like n=1 Tax=Brassica oleracea var. oleracea TaxID=109376 RepID=UPI0006A70E05|nr:PREDICTED: mucin-17-like [Brassica oleracea var. oleracea]
MSNPWATVSRSSASLPSSCTTGDKRNLIPPDPPDPLSHLPLAQYPPLSPTIPSRRSRAIAFSTVAPLLSTPTVQQISAGFSTTDIAPCNVDTEMILENASIVDPQTRSEATVDNTIALQPQTTTTVASSTDLTNTSSETFTVLPPKPTSPIQTNKTSSSTPTVTSVCSDAAPLPSEKTTAPPPLAFDRPQTFVKPLPLPPNPTLVEKIRRFEDKTLKRIAPATISASGRPTVMIPDTVFQKGADLHKDFIWTSTTRSTAPSFSSIKIWAHLTGIPLDLRHQDGLSLVAGLVGEPKETDDFTKNLVSLTLAHAKVEVDLTKPLPDVVEFTRQSGEVVEVLVAYPRLPPTCSHCKELGHIAKNCLLILPPQKAPPPPAPRTKTPPATKEPPVPNHHHSSPSKSTAKPSPKVPPKNPTPINPLSALPSATTTPYPLPLDPKSVVPPAIPMEAPSDSRSPSSFSTPKKLKPKSLSILNTSSPISFSSASHPTFNIPSPSYQPSLKRSRSDPSISPPNSLSLLSSSSKPPIYPPPSNHFSLLATLDSSHPMGESNPSS